jgi:hypothetical protein
LIFIHSLQIPTASQGFVVPSEPSIEAMNVNSEPRHSIIRPVDSDHSLSPRIPSPNRNRISNKVCFIFLVLSSFFLFEIGVVGCCFFSSCSSLLVR